MSEVKRYHVTENGLVEGQALGRLNVVLSADFDRVTAERGAALAELDMVRKAVPNSTLELVSLQQSLTAADERVDVLEGLLRTSIIAMKRIYQAGYNRIIAAGGTCDTPEYMMESDPTAREIRAALKPAETQPCCTISAGNQALLDAGDYTPEELFGVGGKPSCPKCAP